MNITVSLPQTGIIVRAEEGVAEKLELIDAFTENCRTQLGGNAHRQCASLIVVSIKKPRLVYPRFNQVGFCFYRFVNNSHTG